MNPIFNKSALSHSQAPQISASSTAPNMVFVPNAQQSTFQSPPLFSFIPSLNQQQAAQLLVLHNLQQLLANSIRTAAAAEPTPPISQSNTSVRHKSPTSKPFPSLRATSASNIIPFALPVKKLRDSLYQGKGSPLIDSHQVITKKLDKLLEACDPRPLVKGSAEVLVTYQRRIVRLASRLCERVVCDLLIRVRPIHDIHIWHLLRNKGVEFTGTDVILKDGRRECLQEVVLEKTIEVFRDNFKKQGARVEDLSENNANPRLFLSRSELGNLVAERCQTQIDHFIERGAGNQKSKATGSKTKVSRVLQILYRSGCFLIEKHEFPFKTSTYQQQQSSRWLLKPEFWLESDGADASSNIRQLRQQHDQLIVRLAHDVGYHLSPEKWAKLLRNETAPTDSHQNPKAQPHSEMQSVVDREKRPLSHWTKFLEDIVNLAKSSTPGVNQKPPPPVFVEALDALKKLANFADRDKKSDDENQSEAGVAAAPAPDFPPDCCESAFQAVQKVIEAAMLAHKLNWRLNTQLAEGLYLKPPKNKRPSGEWGRERHSSSFSLSAGTDGDEDNATEELEVDVDDLASDLDASLTGTLSQGRSVAPSPSPTPFRTTPFLTGGPTRNHSALADAPRKGSLPEMGIGNGNALVPPPLSATEPLEAAKTQAMLDGLFGGLPNAAAPTSGAYATSELPITSPVDELHVSQEMWNQTLSILNKLQAMNSEGRSSFSFDPLATPTPTSFGFATAPAFAPMSQPSSHYQFDMTPASQTNSSWTVGSSFSSHPSSATVTNNLWSNPIAYLEPSPCGLDTLEDGALPQFSTQHISARTVAGSELPTSTYSPSNLFDEHNTQNNSPLKTFPVPHPMGPYQFFAEEEALSNLERIEAQSTPSTLPGSGSFSHPFKRQALAHPSWAQFHATQNSRRMLRTMSIDCATVGATTEPDFELSAKQMCYGVAPNQSTNEIPLSPRPTFLARTCSHDPSANDV